MHLRSVVLIIIASMMIGCATTAHAAGTRLSIGLHANWGSETDYGVGPRAIVGLAGLLRGLEAVGSFDYFYPRDESGLSMTYWEVNTNLVYRIALKRCPVTPYAGGGLNVTQLKASIHVLEVNISGVESETGFNILGGLAFDIGGMGGFVEGRMELAGGKQFIASVGIRM